MIDENSTRTARTRVARGDAELYNPTQVAGFAAVRSPKDDTDRMRESKSGT